MTLVTRHEEQFNDASGAVDYLPLTDDDKALAGNGAGEPSIGTLVRDTSTRMSALVRAEIELAKSEVIGEVKKGVKGSVYFIIALVVALYSSFFFFFFLGELLSVWLWRWAAFLIVFGLMLAVAVVSGLLGWRKVRKIHAPEETIESVKKTSAVFARKKSDEEADAHQGGPSRG
ncbi:phage holin family protein [Haloechinothrix salitolerans]|uniref:Phage holin family protein n=1 Tax=Haloechinothrix salitolerans TaxID=926830 RepID=A0ABW2BU88_9PSEU